VCSSDLGKETPAYITLCLKTVDKNCHEFNIIRLNKNNIYDYLPELEKYIDKINKLIIAHRVDIYRIYLLYKYGGIYMDADIIVLRNPIEITKKLEQYDFVGFGCTGNKCKYGYSEPSNWLLVSRKQSILMKQILDTLLEKINKQDTFNYHDLGKLVIWKELKDLINNHNYKYYHYPNKIDGSRDKNGNWVTNNIIFSDKTIEYNPDDEKNMLFLVLYNSESDANIKNMSEQEIMAQEWNYTRFLKRALN
jgi:hypothetical protein